MRKLLLFLLLTLFSISASAKFNPQHIAYTEEPDEKSVLLGLGQYVAAGYAKAIYVCPRGGDDTLNDGLTPDTPYKTFAKARESWNSQPAGTVIALCRGDVFYETVASSFLNNVNTTKDSPITIRDYQRSQDKETKPAKVVMNYSPCTSYFLNIQDNGDANHEEGVVLENLEITSFNPQCSTALNIHNDTDYVWIRNNYLHHMGSPFGVSVNTNNPTLRVAAEVINDLTFTSVTNGPDTLTRATGVWSTSIKSGDGIYVSGSTSNNKIYRVEARVSDTVLSISEGRLWEVTNEANTAGVSITINQTDSKNSHVTVEHNKITYTASGIFTALVKSSFSYNILSHNGGKRATFDHNLYVSKADDFIIKNNVLSNNNPYQGTICKSASLVIHGKSNWGVIEDNLIYQADGDFNETCWGIAFDTGYTEYEEFLHYIVRGNTLLNMGSVAIGCNACQDVEIYNNEIYFSSATGGGSGIVIPDKGPTAYGNPLITGINIHDNVFKGIGTSPSAKTNVNFEGIYIGTGADTTGTSQVTNNIVDNFYSCINIDSTGTGQTVSVTGNTTTNCGAGGGQQP